MVKIKTKSPAAWKLEFMYQGGRWWLLGAELVTLSPAVGALCPRGQAGGEKWNIRFFLSEKQRGLPAREDSI